MNNITMTLAVGVRLNPAHLTELWETLGFEVSEVDAAMVAVNAQLALNGLGLSVAADPGEPEASIPYLYVTRLTQTLPLLASAGIYDLNSSIIDLTEEEQEGVATFFSVLEEDEQPIEQFLALSII